MDKKYLQLLSKEFPNIDSAASEIVDLSAIRCLPKGTEYFFSDMHGEYEAFLHMLKSASGMIKIKIDLTLGKTVSSAEREALAALIYYPDKEQKRHKKRVYLPMNGEGSLFIALFLFLNRYLQSIPGLVSEKAFLMIWYISLMNCLMLPMM